MIGIIYKFTIISIEKRESHKPFYIGQHWEKKSVEHFLNRYTNYWGSGNIWLEYLNHLKKIRPNKWRYFIKREILYSKEGISQAALDALEKHFIKKYKAHYSNKVGGCNVLWGTANQFGSGNPMFDERIRKKVGDKIKGKCAGEKCFWYGKHLSEETKRIISEKAKKRLAEYNPHKGMKRSKETCEKIRQRALQRDKSTFRRGFTVSEETRKKLSDSVKKYYETHNAPFKGRKHTEETKAKLSEIHRKHS